MKKTNEKRIGKVGMMSFGLLAACAAVCLCFTGCTTTSSDGPDPGTEPEGEKTMMAISIPVVKTYADNNAKSEEVAISTVDIYVYGGSLETHESLTLSAFTLVTDKYQMNNPIEVLSGSKRIYVGINLPAAAKTVIESGGGLQGLYQATTLRDAISNSSGFAMFSVNTTANTAFTIEAGVVAPRTESKNVFDITVARWAAKVTARKADNLSTAPQNKASGATFQTTATGDLTFCMGNVNTKLYPLQKKDAVGVIEDPNYASNYTSFGSDFVNDFGTNTSLIPTAYVEVNTNGTAATARNTKYTVENTSESPYLQGLMSYVSIRAKFAPDEIITAYTPGQTDSLTRASNSTVQNDLYVYTTAGGEYLYFTSATVAGSWATATDGENFLGNYKNGYCYYLVYLDPKAEYMAPYASIRNFFYDVRITNFNSLGYPNPEEPDPEGPLGTLTMLMVDVTIQNWVIVGMDTDLGEL
ncbi:MAG: Mfa1 family fimbria major subunit [Tannerella sp.]|jgi:hypothetical protein|nr:Mfa1 family fimbria major subunit [Tannerella sp.]